MRNVKSRTLKQNEQGERLKRKENIRQWKRMRDLELVDKAQ